ncbi:unnamed protein product [Pieris macdunnoughi]|uniref:Uncharacterized protein n=1 Tax=Pieris macdunnoughi TaxID=345717 RepID=A0A821XQU8_9NEOP|nr:unnamed protein product [Pieris macdunnoughi]
MLDNKSEIPLCEHLYGCNEDMDTWECLMNGRPVGCHQCLYRHSLNDFRASRHTQNKGTIVHNSGQVIIRSKSKVELGIEIAAVVMCLISIVAAIIFFIK